MDRHTISTLHYPEYGSGPVPQHGSWRNLIMALHKPPPIKENKMSMEQNNSHMKELIIHLAESRPED